MLREIFEKYCVYLSCIICFCRIQKGSKIYEKCYLKDFFCKFSIASLGGIDEEYASLLEKVFTNVNKRKTATILCTLYNC